MANPGQAGPASVGSSLMVDFWSGVRSEMRQVVWPQRPDVLRTSKVVAVVLALVALLLLLTDVTLGYFGLQLFAP